MTITPTGGTGQTYPTSGLGPSWGQFGYPEGYGSLSVTSEETYDYYWVPDEGYSIDDDPPVAENRNVGGDVTFQFAPDSGSAWVAGSASATATINGTTVSAACSTSPDGMGGSITHQDQSGWYSIVAWETLSGTEGSFTIHYSLQLSAPNVIAVATNPGGRFYDPPTEFIAITSPKEGDPWAEDQEATVKGWWSGFATSGEYRIRIYAHHSPDPDEHLKGEVIIPASSSSRKWEKKFELNDDGDVYLWATLEYRPNSQTGWSFIDQSHSVKVIVN